MTIPSSRYLANQRAQRELVRISQSFANVRESATRHKCFISYHGADAEEVLKFVQNYDDVFIPRVIGITSDDPAIDSNDSNYIMDRIREKYLQDSTVTILMVGSCTWSRKFIDWEIYSSLRRGKINRLNGVMALQLPSVSGIGGKLPARLDDNILGADGKAGYARYWAYPTSKQSLRSCIDDAFSARTARAHLIDNSRTRKINNSPCP